MNKTGIPYLDFCWNPGGFGCTNSANCPTCWSRRQATQPGPTRPTCPDCQAFRVHFHSERLTRKLSPEGRRKPAVIGVQFLGDLFDPARPIEQILSVLELMQRAPQHTYVLLTQQPARAASVLERFYVSRTCPACNGIGSVTAMRGVGEFQHAETIHCRTCGGQKTVGWALPDNWFIGATIKQDYGAWTPSALIALLGIRGRRWLSIEPIEGPVCDMFSGLPPGAIEGVIFGADNQPSAPWSLDWIADAVRSMTAVPSMPGPAIYVKQLWMWNCPNCDALWPTPAGENGQGHCACGTSGDYFRKTLVTDANEFPSGLQLRQLPWTLTTKGGHE